MAEVANIAPGAKPIPLSVLVKGKVINVRRHENKINTLITCPAKDEYSRPAVVEVRSDRRLGEVEQIVAVECELGGFPNNFTIRDTGEQVRSARLTLDALD